MSREFLPYMHNSPFRDRPTDHLFEPGKDREKCRHCCGYRAMHGERVSAAKVARPAVRISAQG